MKSPKSPWTVACATVLLLNGCDEAVRDAAARSASQRPAIDSELERFRAPLPQRTRLARGVATRDDLVKAVIARASARDTASLVHLAVERAEWAWLYYPDSRYARPPYRSPADVQWNLLLHSSEKGLGRLLRELGRRRVVVRAISCRGPETEGANRLWRDCQVSYRADGRDETRRLIRAILERDGQFKVLSYSNDF
jgi:hypothetical protein